MKRVMAEFGGRRAGWFRAKPLSKLGDLRVCPRCGSAEHIGRTTCVVKPLPDDWRDLLPANKDIVSP